MKKISIYIRSKDVSPSGYYRILQYTNRLTGKFYLHNILPPNYYKWFLSQKGKTNRSIILNIATYFFMYIRCCFFLLTDILLHKNIIIISRGLLPKKCMFPLPFLIRKLKSCTTKIIWDFDDDILQSKEISPKEYQLLSINSNKIFVTHTYLANKIDKKYRDKVSILPTTDGDFLNIDLQQQLLHRKEIFNQELRLVWVGSAVNLSHLKPIVSTLDECARIFIEKYNKNIILKVCCSEPLCMATRFLQIENILWEREIAVKCIESSHLGIMPLLPTDYSLGKGGFKLIQYMAAGLPVIGSAVGFNNTIVKNEFGCLISELSNFNEWFCALKKWGINFEDYQKASIASQKEWERSFFMPNNLKKWADALNVEIK